MNAVIEKGLEINPNMKLNEDSEHVEKVLKGLEIKDGYCPCVLAKNEDTKCPCKKMREENICCCKLYVMKK